MTAPERIYMKPNDMYENEWAHPIDTDQFDEEATEYVRADLAAVQPAQVRVKPLVWKQEATNAWVAAHYAIHQYWPHNNGPYSGSGYLGGIGAVGLGKHPTLDAAKAAAQADYEARILAALEPVAQQAVTVKPFGWIGGNADCHHARVNELAEGLQSCTSCGAVSSVVLEPQPDPRDEVIARLVEAVERQDMVRVCTTSGGPNHDGQRWVHMLDYNDLKARATALCAALAAAKAVQHG